MSISVNIVTDYGAVGDAVYSNGQWTGTYNDRAFLNFRWHYLHATDQIELIIPMGNYLLQSGRLRLPTTRSGYIGYGPWTSGLRNLVICGNGSRLISHLYSIGFGGDGICATPLGADSARFYSVSAGSYYIDLIKSSDAALFTVKMWVLLGGLELMCGGWPPSFHYQEYRQIAGISGGRITFTEPLVHSYDETWPSYDDLHPDAGNGGPGTIYRPHPTWDCVQEVRDLIATPQNFTSQDYAKCRQIILKNVTMESSGGIVPTQNQLFHAENCDYSRCKDPGIETDKCIETVEWVNCNIDTLIHPGSCAEQVSISGGTTIGFMAGTPKRLTMTGGSIGTLRIGPSQNFGLTEQLIVDGVNIVELVNGCPMESNINNLTIQNGVIARPVSWGYNAPPWGVPGNVISYGSYDGTRRTEIAGGQIVSLVRNGSNIAVTTSLPLNAWPNVPEGQDGLSLFSHPCRSATFTNCTGAGADFSNLPTGTPLFSRWIKTYQNDDLSSLASVACPLFGKLIYVRVNVTQASSHSSAAVFNCIAYGINASGTQQWFSAISIDLRQTGERIVTPTSASGGQPGDILTTFGYRWVEQGMVPGVSASLRSDSVLPTFTVELITDQGVLPVTRPLAPPWPPPGQGYGGGSPTAQMPPWQGSGSSTR
jgi:hypothetical protein